MRKAAAIVVEVLLKIEDILKPGMTTEYLNRVAEKIIDKRHAVPAFKGYKGSISKKPFPSSICVSINQEVVHGIPSKREIADGDLVSIDVGVKLGGFFGDAARSFLMGEVSPDVRRLWTATKEALHQSIRKCNKGARLSDISHCIESRAKKDGFSVVRDFVGHGIGRDMHEEPQILNYGPPGKGPVLKNGMVLAIEPMLNMGASAVKVLKDGWTVVTKDGKTSCHFEDMVALSEHGPLVLTQTC